MLINVPGSYCTYQNKCNESETKVFLLPAPGFKQT